MEPTTQPTQPSLPPTYKQMLEAMGQQLSSRKSALMKRVALITWPYILLVVLGYVSQQFFNFDTLSLDQRVALVVGVSIYILLSLVYTSIVSFIFQIEKQIWVDSFFDQKNLSLQESWRIAKKLFWPAIVFRLKLWVRFYLPILIVVAVIVGVFITTIIGRIFKDALMLVALLCIFAILIGVPIYTYFIRTKLRYSWFLFLDKFGTTNSFEEIINEMNRLNTISKTETFKKSLVTNLGTDSVNALANIAIGTISFGLSHLGGAGKAVGHVVEIYGKEMSRQATDLGNIAAQYILYRFARKEAFGQEQQVNETLYNLK